MPHQVPVSSDEVQVPIAVEVGKDALVAHAEKADDVDVAVGQLVALLPAQRFLGLAGEHAVGQVRQVNIRLLYPAAQAEDEGTALRGRHPVNVIHQLAQRSHGGGKGKLLPVRLVSVYEVRCFRVKRLLHAHLRFVANLAAEGLSVDDQQLALKEGRRAEAVQAFTVADGVQLNLAFRLAVVQHRPHGTGYGEVTVVTGVGGGLAVGVAGQEG